MEANGQNYQELHVDGGAVSQAFLVSPSVNTRDVLAGSGYRRKAVTAYIIRNSRLTTEWTDVEQMVLPIAERAVSTMINYNGVGDLYRMYLVTRRAGAAFNPPIFRQPSTPRIRRNSIRLICVSFIVLPMTRRPTTILGIMRRQAFRRKRIERHGASRRGD